MPDDPIITIATEIAKQLPVKDAYQDVAAPGMKQAGQAIEDIVKTLRLAFLPLHLAGAYFDRASRSIHKSIEKVPSDDRIAPQPQILGPVMEGIRYEPEDSPVDDMFTELLSKAFSKQNSGKAHPSFPSMIKQLSSDEAVLLRAMWEDKDRVSFEHIHEMKLVRGKFEGFRTIRDTIPGNLCQYPGNMEFYIAHLHSMGLAGIFKDDEVALRDASGTQTGTRVTERLRLTRLGKQFMAAVSPALSERPVASAGPAQ